MIFSSIPSSFWVVFVFAIVLRVVLILYSEWHDSHSVVKYTDVDYRVFTDAAFFLLRPGPNSSNQPEGPFGKLFPVGSPYTRETYRYTPLLALLLTPNVWLSPSFGKYVFSLCDILNGILIYQLLRTEILPRSQPSYSAKKLNKKDSVPNSSIERLSTLYSSIHLLNPLVFSISTRGSSESVLSLFVLLTLYASLKGRWDLSAVMLGISTHWKIYPIIYGVGCLAAIQPTSFHKATIWPSRRGIVNLETIRFTFISAATFFILGTLCYAIWGYPFLHESYLYHLHRLDHRHNFSPYFYWTYLMYPSVGAPPETLSITSRILRSPLASFVPQMSLAVGLGLLFGRRKETLVFTWFVQTTAFVVFNKVCTSQYFLWYLLLLPLLLPDLSLSFGQSLLYTTVWVGTQALWLSEAYSLEFLGKNAFRGLWARSLIYVVANCWVLVGIMKAYRPQFKVD